MTVAMQTRGRSSRRPSSTTQSQQIQPINNLRIEDIQDNALVVLRRERDEAIQVVTNRISDFLQSLRSSPEIQSFVEGFTRQLDATQRFMTLCEDRGRPTVALVALGCAFVSMIGLLACQVVFYTSIVTLKATASSWSRTKTILILVMLSVVVILGYVLGHSNHFYVGTGCGILVGGGALGIFYF